MGKCYEERMVSLKDCVYVENMQFVLNIRILSFSSGLNVKRQLVAVESRRPDYMEM